MANNNFDIDLVYLWVDGNDPVWRAKRNVFIGKTDENSSVNCEGRYANNDELMFSLRSAEKYAPWIRKIFIITDDQIPNWLDITHPKISVIDHKEIMPPDSLPCFNSVTIEHFLFNIPDLSEYFLYANDDIFFNKTVTPNTFFGSDGLPIIRFHYRFFRKWTLFFSEKILKRTLSNYNQTIRNAAELVERKYGIYCNIKPHHNIDAYLKSDCLCVRDIFKDELEATFSNRVRSSNDIQRSLYSYVAFAEKRGHFKHSTNKDAFHFHIHKDHHYQKFEKYNPMLFCMNDSEYATDSHRMKANTFLQKLFPEKSQFEK